MDLVKIRMKAQKEKEKKEKAGPSVSERKKRPPEEASAPVSAVVSPAGPVPPKDAPAQPGRPPDVVQEDRAGHDVPVVEAGREVTVVPTGQGVESGALIPSNLSGEKDFLELASEELYKQSYIREERGERLELLCFRLSTEEYAIPVLGVKEIIRPREITEVPRVPDYIVGVISLRGVIVPVFDLRKRLGLSVKEMTKSTRIVIASDDTKTLGMVVDEVTEVMRIPSETLEPPPPVIGGVEGEYIQGVGRDQHKMVILLNLRRILDVDMSLDMRT